ncbi:SLAP domain-containing protein [Companilactobacillus huachuanensis]|uniref:SLAP domain-containing protein n=1 Tax=Companilactobacillus huachuanensis TaxID=2559914 RepID=A0ABW1RPQ3_9LACO|nr:SLAP domain-containing protein [Companilactobacillus huachuanensis]
MKKLLYSSIILGAGLFAFGIKNNTVLTVKAAEISTESVSIPSEVKTEEVKDPVNSQQIATNRINKTKDGIPYVEIRPTDEAIVKDPQRPLSNVNDPAYEGELMVPYTYYGNGAVYVLDDNNQPIPDANSETGYQMRRSEDVYEKEIRITDVSSEFTGTVYGINEGTQTTKKEKMLAALKREGAFYMEFRNHGYSTKAELIAYQKAFENKLAEISNLNDDGTLVVKTPVTETTTVSHNHSSTAISNQTQNDEKLPLVVVTIRQAQLYSTEGKTVTDRGLSDNTVWVIDKIAMINGQKMYRISANEWVAANDVI